MVCVIIWLSLPSHELFGPGMSTEAGFVRALGGPRSLVHPTAWGHTNTHKADEKATEEMEM